MFRNVARYKVNPHQHYEILTSPPPDITKTRKAAGNTPAINAIYTTLISIISIPYELETPWNPFGNGHFVLVPAVRYGNDYRSL